MVSFPRESQQPRKRSKIGGKATHALLPFAPPPFFGPIYVTGGGGGRGRVAKGGTSSWVGKEQLAATLLPFFYFLLLTFQKFLITRREGKGGGPSLRKRRPLTLFPWYEKKLPPSETNKKRAGLFLKKSHSMCPCRLEKKVHRTCTKLRAMNRRSQTTGSHTVEAPMGTPAGDTQREKGMSDSWRRRRRGR